MKKHKHLRRCLSVSHQGVLDWTGKILGSRMIGLNFSHANREYVYEGLITY